MSSMAAPLVKLRFYANLRTKAGVEEISCSANRLKDVISYLGKEYDGDFNKQLDMCHIYLNQDNVVFLKGPNTRLKDGDVLHLLPPTGGG